MRYSVPVFIFSLLLNGGLGSTRPSPDAATKKPSKPSIPVVNKVTLDGATYINKGLVAFGLIPSDFKESTGDTLGGIGSAIALKPKTWKASRDGSFSGTLFVHPDRGFNVNGTIDYQARYHEVDFTLKPYYDSENLDFKTGQKTLSLKYKKTVLEWDRDHKRTSGLSPAGVRESGSRGSSSFNPPLPIVSKADDRLVLDVEGFVANHDGSYWLSDEYGPNVLLFSSKGELERAVSVPDALLPRDAAGNLNFTEAVNPATGRTPNQGFEGLTVDPSTGILYAMLQTATIQDGGADKTTSRFTRLLAFDVKSPRSELVGEWVIPLPLSSKNKTEGCSEVAFVSPGIFLALSRDGDGRGGDDANSGYKKADLFSIRHATNIRGSKFDSSKNPIAVNGVLDRSIRPAEYVQFIDYVDPTQLARFGLHNGKPDDETLVNSKWESFALAPAEDPHFPDDYFLITVSDNDFISTHGVSLGKPFNAGLDVDNQFMVFRVTLPGVSDSGHHDHDGHGHR